MKKSEFKKNLGRKIALALGVGMFSLLPLVQALPAGGQSDSATIKVSGSTMDISGAANNVINWQSFSIGKNETVSFDAGNYLNLVNGPDVSNIYGTLKGAGNIFLVNPNGIVFGSGAVINVGSLTASTAPINSVDTAAFLNGNTTSITGSVTEGSDISMALVNVEAANSLVLNAGEVVLQNTAVLDKVTSVTGATNVIIGTTDGNLSLTGGQTLKLHAQNVNGATLVTDLSQITDMSGKYLLAGDVDLSSASFTSLGAAGEEMGSMATPFTGYFNGLGYTVNKLSGSNGLFAQIGNSDLNYDFNTGEYSGEYSGGTVKNLRLENVAITGLDDSGTGALAGKFVDGVVSNIYVSGNITSAGYFAGGIVGAMGGDSAGFSAKLTNAENTATVTGGTTGGDIGGVVGILKGGTITNAKNSGAVDGTYNIGGIAGQTGNTGATINYAYNSGAIKAVGSEYGMPVTAGGIVGSMEGDGLTIDNAYNSGTVTGDTVGGIVGSFEFKYSSWDEETQSLSETTVTYSPTVTNSYYANVTNPSGNTYGTSVSAADLQAKVDAIWGGTAASGPETPSTDPTTPTTPTTPTDSQSGSSSGGETAASDSGKPSSEPKTPTTPTDTPTTPTADSQSGSSSRMDVIRDILTELMDSNMSSEQRRSMERDTENNIVAATSNPGRGDRPMAAMPTADTGAAAPAGDSSIVENTDKSAPTGGEVNSNDNEDEN